MTSGAPIFQPVFGKDWNSLPPVMHQHYANRPFTSDVVRAEGEMDVVVSRFARFLTPFMRLSGALAPYPGHAIPTIVDYESEKRGASFYLNRLFHYPGAKPYRFRSRMVVLRGNEVIEFMPPGIGWHARYRFDGRKILLEHLGYKLRFMGMTLPVPMEYLLGKGYAEEEALGDDIFRMYMDIRHPLFGLVYSYSGRFRIKEVRLDA